MKRLFCLLFICFVCISANLWAWDTTLWVVLQSYPRNAGQVQLKLSTDKNLQVVRFTRNVVEDNATIWGDSVSATYVLETDGINEYYRDYLNLFGNNTQKIVLDPWAWYIRGVIYYCSAKANNGYQFIGFSRSYFHKTNEWDCWQYHREEDWENSKMYDPSKFEFNTEVIQTDNPGLLCAPLDDLGTVEYHITEPNPYDIPNNPNEYAWALFTRVAIGKCAGGRAKIDSKVNEMGDVVTISATPNNDGYAFAYWTEESTGRQITANPYTFEVTGLETYIPHFVSAFDGVDAVKVDGTSNNACYNLKGERVGDKAKGIIIKNKTKIIRK